MLRRAIAKTVNFNRSGVAQTSSGVGRPSQTLTRFCAPISSSRFFADKAKAENTNPQGYTPVLPLHVVDNPMIQKALPYVGTVGYLIIASGMAMTDVLMLRTGLALGYCFMCGFHSFQYRPLRIPLAASIFYVILNTVLSIKIFMDRQTSLTEEEQKIHAEFFQDDMVDYEFEKIIRAGTVKVADKAEIILNAGDMHENLFFVLGGRMQVTFADESHAYIDKSSFMGEGSFIGKPHKSRSTVHALDGCKYVQWNLATLTALCSKDPNARRAVEVKVGRELAHKLKATSDRLTHAEHQLMVMRLCFGTKKDNIADALEEAFKQADTDGGGSIEFDEFSSMMRRFDDPKDPLTELQLLNLFAHIDVDGGGDISLEEFLGWMKV